MYGVSTSKVEIMLLLFSVRLVSSVRVERVGAHQGVTYHVLVLSMSSWDSVLLHCQVPNAEAR